VTGSDRKTLLMVGRVVKALGLAGDVVVHLLTDRVERMNPGAVVFVGDRTLTVERASTNGRDWRVRFAEIDSRSAAEALAGRELLAHPIEDPDALWVDDLIGSRVVDSAGVERGIVTAVQANPASDLLVLTGGHLVPLVFVTEFSAKTVVIDPPDGLFGLDD
jgi:16S rRNA processing protein RimM